MRYASARDVTRHTAELVRPPRRMLPTDAAAKYLQTEKGPWDPSLAPMMAEPLNMLASRDYTGVVFVGPARGSKTMSLILGGLAYIIKCAPGDTLITQMSQDSARDFSRTDLDRAIRHSPALLEAMSPRARDDNTYDKFFRSGIVVKIGWPAVSQLSSKTLRYVLLTDYDRPDNRDNVDGEGPMWDLAQKRTETFMSRGKTVAESSPEAELMDAKWRPSSPHEAPPCRGILELYNRGTRARWFWPCQHCGEHFQAMPGLSCFALPDRKELEERVLRENLLAMAERYAQVVCTHCGGLHEQRQRTEMSVRGRWLHEGEKLAHGAVIGERRGTRIASYWLGGVAATFQRWDSMLLKYFQSMAGFLKTGEESALKFTVNTDQAAAYMPRAVEHRRSSDDLRSRLEDWARGSVPDGVRFLTAAIDVQAGRFVVEVFGWGAGLESWLVDRFTISSSKRAEGDRTAALQPAAYLEDWQLIHEQVIDRTYRCGDQVFVIRLVTCDSGGEAGVTAKAYAFFRWLRARRQHRRFRLVKGASRIDAPTATMSWPDASDRKDRKQGGRGDVPVWVINTNVLKDAVVGDLARVEVGPGYVHLPNWLEDSFFAELSAEVRTDKGWKNPQREANEAFDLHVYNRAACKILRADKIDWSRPPKWAAQAKIAEPAAAEEDTEAEFLESEPEQPAVRKTESRQRPTRRKNWVRSW